jgi:amino acid transporter
MSLVPAAGGAAAALGQQRLRANAVGFFGTLAQSVSDIGPSPSVALVVPLVFVIAGNGSWLSWVLVTAVLLCVAFCCAELARRYATTGGLIGLVAITGSRTRALAVAGCVLGFAILGSPANVLGTGILFQHWLSTFGVAPGTGLLLALSLASLAVGFYLSYRGMRLSATALLLIESMTLCFIGALLIIVLIRHHHGSVVDSGQLSLRGVSAHNVLLGSAAAAFAVSSFECSATLGEESRQARRTIPRSLYVSVCFTGALFIAASYVMTLGFDGTKLSLATSADPLSDLATLYGVSDLRYFVLLGVALGYFAVIVAFTNWSARVMFTLAREGLLPGYFAGVDQRTGTPKRAVIALAAVTMAGIILLVITRQATLAVWGYMATAAALMYLVAYIIAMLALGVYGFRELRSRLMLAAGVAGSAAFGYALYSSVYPAPRYPLSAWTWAGVGVGAASCLLALALRTSGARVARSFGQSVRADTTLADIDEATLGLGGPGVSGVAAGKLRAGGDSEFPEHLPQVVLHGARADEQPRRDRGVGQALTGQPRDLILLGSQLIPGTDGSLAGLLAGGQQLPAGPFRKTPGAHRHEHVMGGAKLPAGVQAAALPAQPLPVQQVRPRQVQVSPGSPETADGLLVEDLGCLIVGQQSARASQQALPEFSSSRQGARCEPLQGAHCRFTVVAARRGLDQVG